MQLQEPHSANCWVRLTSFLCVLPGTFITEWKEGERLCEAFLAGDERSYQAVADQLVLIAQFFRFDGWLINIENSLSVSIASLPVLAQPSPWPCAVPPPLSSASLLGQQELPLASELEPAQISVISQRHRMFSGAVSRHPGWLSFALVLLQADSSPSSVRLARAVCVASLHAPSPFMAFCLSLIAAPMSFLLQKEGELGRGWLRWLSDS